MDLFTSQVYKISNTVVVSIVAADVRTEVLEEFKKTAILAVHQCVE
jgi:hypothetical protein